MRAEASLRQHRNLLRYSTRTSTSGCACRNVGTFSNAPAIHGDRCYQKRQLNSRSRNAFENLSPKLLASMVRERSRLNIKALIDYLYQTIKKTDLPGPHSQPSYGIMSFRFIRRPLFPFFL